jgi:hypothetical protein
LEGVVTDEEEEAADRKATPQPAKRPEGEEEEKNEATDTVAAQSTS